jgi:hypothetical protein
MEQGTGGGHPGRRAGLVVSSNGGGEDDDEEEPVPATGPMPAGGEHRAKGRGGRVPQEPQDHRWLASTTASPGSVDIILFSFCLFIS